MAVTGFVLTDRSGLISAAQTSPPATAALGRERSIRLGICFLHLRVKKPNGCAGFAAVPNANGSYLC